MKILQNKINNMRRLFLLLICIVLINVASTQVLFPFSGDYSSYLSHYSGSGGERFEPLYKGLVLIFNYILGYSEASFLFFMVVVSSITLFGKAYVSYRINPASLVFFCLIYLIYFYLLHEANQVRVSIGLSFSIVSIYFLSKDNYLKYLFLMFIAIGFHYSMALFLMAFFVHKGVKKNRIKLMYLVIVLSTVLIHFLLDYGILGKINPLINTYLDFNLEYKFNPFYLTLLLLLGYLGAANNLPYFGRLMYHLFIFLIIVALSIRFIPILSVRIMDLVNVVGLFFVASTRFSLKLKPFFLYLTMASIAIPRFYIFVTTDTIYNF